MPRVQKLAQLFQAIAENNFVRAETIAAEFAAAEERKGHRTASQLLRGALRPNGHNVPFTTSAVDRIPNTGSTLSSALTSITEKATFDDLMLRPPQKKELLSIVTEWKYRARLEAKAITRRSRLFFHGPPGCGKSLAAKALGCELGLPTYVVRFDAIIGAYLGQTAIHLRELFQFSTSTPCVLLFDEVDALGKKRGNPLDVGELDRIVIAFMQELEHSRTRGIIVATSNLPQHLDDALWRRFDLILEFPKPNARELLLFGRKVSHRRKIRMSKSLLHNLAHSRSYAEAEKNVDAEARRLVLQHF